MIVHPLAECVSKVEVVQQPFGREMSVSGPPVLLVDGGVRGNAVKVISERPGCCRINPLNNRVARGQLAHLLDVGIERDRTDLLDRYVSDRFDLHPSEPAVTELWLPDVIGHLILKRNLLNCASPPTQRVVPVTAPSAAR